MKLVLEAVFFKTLELEEKKRYSDTVCNSISSKISVVNRKEFENFFVK